MACKFCKEIYDDRLFGEPITMPEKSHIEFDSTLGRFDISVDTGDPYMGAYLERVEYCPYCGRKLERSKP